MSDFEQISSQAVYTVVRLKPGTELIGGIREAICAFKPRAAFIAASVGSLSTAALRFAGRSDTTLLTGTFETVSLSGTIDSETEHLHLSIADDGGRMTGGHLMRGSVVRTTMELVIGILPELVFVREYCPLSAYDELKIKKQEFDENEE